MYYHLICRACFRNREHNPNSNLILLIDYLIVYILNELYIDKVLLIEIA